MLTVYGVMRLTVAKVIALFWPHLYKTPAKSRFLPRTPIEIFTSGMSDVDNESYQGFSQTKSLGASYDAKR